MSPRFSTQSFTCTHLFHGLIGAIPLMTPTHQTRLKLDLNPGLSSEHLKRYAQWSEPLDQVASVGLRSVQY